MVKDLLDPIIKKNVFRDVQKLYFLKFKIKCPKKLFCPIFKSHYGTGVMKSKMWRRWVKLNKILSGNDFLFPSLRDSSQDQDEDRKRRLYYDSIKYNRSGLINTGPSGNLNCLGIV